MFKRFLALALAGVMLLGLISCEKPDDSDKTEGTEGTEGGTGGNKYETPEQPQPDGSDKTEDTEGTEGGTGGDEYETPEQPQPDGSIPCDYYLERKEVLSRREVAYVTLELEELGSIKLALDATAAPITVRHFLRLVSEGFYDGLGFFAARSGDSVYSGCPENAGYGVYEDENGKAVCIEGEFSTNGYNNNDTLHKRGVISMLRMNQNDSASSMFYICNTELTADKGYYAAFGYVTDGMDIIDRITSTEQSTDPSTGLIPADKQVKIKRATVDDLGGIDITEQFYLKSGTCEYADRDITGRDVVYVEMTVRHYGTVKLLLDRTTAPITVDNFVSLVSGGFYDGLTFHRVIEGFMIQGGDPDADGTGGNTDADGNEINIKGEFSANGWENDILHKRGVISMARGNDMDSASSQFFIMNADAASLDGNYAAFGYVVEGLRIIDEITRATAIYGNPYYSNTIYDKDKQAVIESIRVVTD